jgi:hypothetical protein
MSHESSQSHPKAVVCIFCGLQTPVSRRSLDSMLGAITRCQTCGREAAYPADKIVDRQEMPVIGTLRARAVGLG